jgi:hypothetical protein
LDLCGHAVQPSEISERETAQLLKILDLLELGDDLGDLALSVVWLGVLGERCCGLELWRELESRRELLLFHVNDCSRYGIREGHITCSLSRTTRQIFLGAW